MLAPMRLAALAFRALTLVFVTSSAVFGQTPADVAARVGGEIIHVADVDAWLARHDPAIVDRLRRQEYEQRRRALDALIDEALLLRDAEREGLSTASLLERETSRRAGTVGPEQVAAFLAENPLPPGTDAASAAPTVAALLQRRSRDVARQAYLDELRRGPVAVQLVLEPPRAGELVAPHSPRRGAAAAPIEVVVFSDFECPFCRRVVPALARLEERFPGDVSFVWRHFPLAMHPRAAPAAEASQCAHAQGRFWQYHDALFRQPERLDAAGLEEAARTAGLDLESFTRCVSTHVRAGDVERDREAGSRAGVTGTPTVYINGVQHVGALPFEAYERAVLEELARTRQGSRDQRVEPPPAGAAIEGR